VLGQDSFDVGDVVGGAVAVELAQQLLVARVTAVERADAHAGVLGDGGDLEPRIAKEDGSAPIRGSAGRCEPPRVRLDPRVESVIVC
jgi:hypothetical protein